MAIIVSVMFLIGLQFGALAKSDKANGNSVKIDNSEKKEIAKEEKKENKEEKKE